MRAEEKKKDYENVMYEKKNEMKKCKRKNITISKIITGQGLIRIYIYIHFRSLFTSWVFFFNNFSILVYVSAPNLGQLEFKTQTNKNRKILKKYSLKAVRIIKKENIYINKNLKTFGLKIK